jgi:hypothetical protein
MGEMVSRKGALIEGEAARAVYACNERVDWLREGGEARFKGRLQDW